MLTPYEEKYVLRANKKHNFKFDYSKIKMTKIHDKITIICPEHGEFIQRGQVHVRSTHGCPGCAGVKRYDHDINEIYEKIDKLYENKYDLSNFIFKNSTTKSEVICKIHGSFKISLSNLLNGTECPKCSKKISKHTTESLIEKLIETRGYKYNYSKVQYNNSLKDKIIIICKEHGEFMQCANNHLNGHDCPSCTIKSRGEEEIKEYLLKNNIIFEKEKSFDDCKYKYKLRFDFFIPSKNLLIEYDGIQHFTPIDFFGGELTYNEELIKTKIKNEYCKNNNINLLRITKNDNIKEILNDWILC